MNNILSSDAPNPEKLVRKRKSSIFHSRVITFDESEGTPPEDGNVEVQNAEVFDLGKYVNSLKEERKMWVDTWKQRKTERRTLTSVKSNLEEHGQALDLNVLTDEERAFIMTKPNYEDIYKISKKLSKDAMKVTNLNRLNYKMNNRFILQMEKRLQEVTKRVIKISES